MSVKTTSSPQDRLGVVTSQDTIFHSHEERVKKSPSRSFLVEESPTQIGTTANKNFEGLSLICQALDEATSKDTLTKDSNYGQTTIPHFLSTLFTAAEIIGRTSEGGNISPSNDVLNDGLEKKNKKHKIKFDGGSQPSSSSKKRAKKTEDLTSEAIACAIMATATCNGATLEGHELPMSGKRKPGKGLRPKKRYDADEKLSIVVDKLKTYLKRTNSRVLPSKSAVENSRSSSDGETDLLLKVENLSPEHIDTILNFAEQFLDGFFNGNDEMIRDLLKLGSAASSNEEDPEAVTGTEMSTGTAIIDSNTDSEAHSPHSLDPSSKSMTSEEKKSALFTGNFSFTFPNHDFANEQIIDLLDFTEHKLKSNEMISDFSSNTMETLSSVDTIVERSMTSRMSLAALLDGVLGTNSSKQVSTIGYFIDVLFVSHVSLMLYKHI